MRTRLLVIGYGNELRGDDGIGPLVARAVAEWRFPGVIALATQQLVPELTEPMSQAEGVVFIDAALDQEHPLKVIDLEPGPMPGLGHTGDPGSLLALVEALHGNRPRAWLITVAGDNFDLGERLSETARRGLALALETLRDLASSLCGSGTGTGPNPHT